MRQRKFLVALQRQLTHFIRPQSAQAPTSKEQLTIDSEMDGTHEGDENAEKKRQEDERWAKFTDENPRGSGNTMNRG